VVFVGVCLGEGAVRNQDDPMSSVEHEKQKSLLRRAMKYGLPGEELLKIFERDTACVYCHKTMLDHDANSNRGDWSTIEHLNHSPPWNDPKTVAFCCWSCNSSRGNKKLMDWFKTPYCLCRDINEVTVAEPVRAYIRENS
jgi:hypothetical protein